MAIYSGFSHEKWWFSIAMWNYQRVEGIFAVSCSWRPKLFYLVKLAIIDGLLGQLFPVLCSAHRRTAHTFPLKSPRIKLRLHPLAPQLATCLVLSHVPWRIHGAGRKMLTWLGFIDGIHVTIYSIHGSYGQLIFQYFPKIFLFTTDLKNPPVAHRGNPRNLGDGGCSSPRGNVETCGRLRVCSKMFSSDGPRTR